MNPGELKERVTILELSKSDSTYSWNTKSKIWASAEKLSRNNIFSQVGIAVKSLKLIIRKNSDITLYNAFKWNGKHCFLTDITEIDRMYYEVTAALMEPYQCSINHTGEPTLNELNRPVYASPTVISFPGCLTEKYLGHTQGDPMSTTEVRYVLVTPKVIELIIGELVEIDNKIYTVLIAHTLDEFKNEYEIIVKGDA